MKKVEHCAKIVISDLKEVVVGILVTGIFIKMRRMTKKLEVVRKIRKIRK